MSTKPLILLDPTPRRTSLVFSPDDWDALQALGRVVCHEDGPMPNDMVEEHLPQASIIIGQTPLDAERLARAKNLKAIINVEGNFLPNIDYDACFARGIHVLTVSRAFVDAVAEMALAFALDLARGISAADRSFRAGDEKFGFAGNQHSFMLNRNTVGIIGFGDIGRAFRPLLAPFRCRVQAYDPWVPDHVLRDHDCEPATLKDLLGSSRFIVVFAPVTTENAGFLGHSELSLIQPDSALLLLSRAGVVDFDALLDLVNQGRFRAAVDVFPEEPMPPDHPVRTCEGMLLSAHRAGALREVYLRIGKITLADTRLILQGLPPQSCKRAERETVRHLRSKPIAADTQRA
jgi:phosphoglycerate dehydrogenase-like enzyme